MRKCATEQQQLLNDIDVVDFTLTDLREYLDTHPNCTEAITYYTHYLKLRHQLYMEYAAKYGPLTSYTPSDNQASCKDEWKWATTCMPWEGGMN